MTLSEVAAALAQGGIENAAGEARMIFDAWGAPFLSPDPQSDQVGIDQEKLAQAIARRCQHEPLQYILGVAWFYRECYEVSPACLIPRSDTECLVDYAIHHLPPNAHFLDMCTGSGCVAISVLCSRPDCTATALDISPEALALAKRNARRNGVLDRMTFLLADALSYTPDTPFDAMLSNHPYIAHDIISTLSTEVQAEPKLALDGGEDGLDFYRHFCKNIFLYIYKEGFCSFEIGFDQGEALKMLSATHDLDCKIIRDFGGCDRVAIIRANPEDAPKH